MDFFENWFKNFLKFIQGFSKIDSRTFLKIYSKIFQNLFKYFLKFIQGFFENLFKDFLKLTQNF